MTLDIKERLTILRIPCDIVRYAIDSSMIDNYEFTVQDAINLKAMLSTDKRN